LHEYLVIDDALNGSDHLPIKIVVKNIDLAYDNTVVVDKCERDIINITMIDSISGNKSYFNEATKILVQSILAKIDALLNIYSVTVKHDSHFASYVELRKNRWILLPL